MRSEVRKSRLVRNAVPSIFQSTYRENIQAHDKDMPSIMDQSKATAKQVVDEDKPFLIIP